ncbi:hypothetical protein D5F01_LYC24082 [Larimichthys crocea]|uniref:1-alkyl-2-acetylglycerophosphocholine esterase n=1 Tax=Larimichthys crocea TaxID=215358 RepID=A0A6G0HF65_LARCR|nr:hypothetical protein D5F01_LYC24082 [Larimichthys crocea]
MPRGKSYRRSQAAKRRVERQETRRLDVNPVPSVPSVQGTGRRHRVRDEERGWERSQLTLKPHKLVVPAAHPSKKFVLLVGDSHLRALVDGFVAMPEGPLAFGFMSTPGATAAQLRTELVAAVLPRDPDAVVLLAPSNNLTACQGLEDSAADFASLLRCARSRWGNVAVLDFPPRLGRAEEQRSQELLRMAYNSVCVKQGVHFHHIAQHFPLHHLDLWARDNTHLSDNAGMPILAYLLWQAAVRQLAEPEAEPPATPVPSSPYLPRFATRVVVVGEERQPRPEANPDGWLTIVKGQKRSLPEAELDQQVAHKMVELKECFIPLTPVRFSPSILALVEKTSPSVLPSPQETTSAPVQVHTVVSHGAVSRDPKPVTPVPVAQEVECVDVEVCFLASPTSAVPTTAMDEDEATQGVVDLTLEPGPRSVVVTTRVGDEPPPGLPQLSPTPGVNAVADGPGFPQLSPTPGVDAVVDGPGQRTDSAIKNRSAYEVESEQLDNVEELINNDGIADDAWCQLCPEQELDRLECREIRREETQATDEPLEDIPDLAVQREQTAHLEKRNTTMCRSDGLALLRSLNETQMALKSQKPHHTSNVLLILSDCIMEPVSMST